MSMHSTATILVVDDNADNAAVVSTFLEARGYAVVVAHSGDEALVAFERLRPAIVLLDVMMPGRNGWDVCRVMKQHPTHGKSVRVIMVTALDDWENKQNALQTGADDYCTKPVDLHDLAARVQRNLALVTPTPAP